MLKLFVLLSLLSFLASAAEIPTARHCVASTKHDDKEYCGCKVVCGYVENLYFPAGIDEDKCEKAAEGCTASATYEDKKPPVENQASNVY